MKIYQYIQENPRKHSVASLSEINSENKKLMFNLGVSLPSQLVNFLSVCNGVEINGFYIYSAREITNTTLNNAYLNIDLGTKKIEVGRVLDTFIYYNYEEDILEQVEYNQEVIESFSSIFSLFDYFYDIFYDPETDIEDQNYDEIISEALISI